MLTCLLRVVVHWVRERGVKEGRWWFLNNTTTRDLVLGCDGKLGNLYSGRGVEFAHVFVYTQRAFAAMH